MDEFLTERQWGYIRHWIILVVTAEVLMICFNSYLPQIYVFIAGLFFAGFCLRVFRVYPGRREPLILDLSAVVIALMFSSVSEIAGGLTKKFLLVFCSSLIIVPHLIYIFRKKDL